MVSSFHAMLEMAELLTAVEAGASLSWSASKGDGKRAFLTAATPIPRMIAGARAMISPPSVYRGPDFWRNVFPFSCFRVGNRGTHFSLSTKLYQHKLGLLTCFPCRFHDSLNGFFR